MVHSEDIIHGHFDLEQDTLAARQVAYEALGGRGPVQEIIRLGASDDETWDRLSEFEQQAYLAVIRIGPSLQQLQATDNPSFGRELDLAHGG
jgi:hypothetical protein